MTELYLVGGAVRDIYLGEKPSDYDFTIVAESYEDMVASVREMGGEIFLEKPEFGTVRASVSKAALEAFESDKFPLPKKIATDFVLARKDGYYSDGRHPDSVEVGSLYDDLARRDFTINAMAIDERGILIDPFGGLEDLKLHILKAVGNPVTRMTEDALRVVRALRFSVTKQMFIDFSLGNSMRHAQVLHNLEHNVAHDRIRQELMKMFKFSTMGSISTFLQYPNVARILFGGDTDLWLKPTLEDK